MEMVRRFSRDEEGSATVEAVLWIPLFFFVLVLVMEASLMFSAQTRVMRIVQDTNRGLAIGLFPDSASAEVALRAQVRPISPTATVVSRIESGLAVSTVQMPVADLSSFGFFRDKFDFSIDVRSQQLIEK